MKKLFLALLVMVSMVSCNSFKINVNLENSNGKTVYLQRYDGEKLVVLDSVVAKNNKSVFRVQRSENLDAFSLMMKGWRRSLTFFADNQDVEITGDYQKYNGINVLASESQAKLNKFLAEVNEIEDEQEIHYFVLDFVKQNIDNPLSPYVLYRYKWSFNIEDFKHLISVMPENMKSGYKCLVMNYMDGLTRTSAGQPYIDFTQQTVDGNNFTLSEIIGRHVIVLDFWASWCPDCRKANPELVKIYNQFKDRGLEIVSISLDTDAKAWKKAIEDDNLAWKLHVSDLKGWNNSVAELYNIAYIPQNLIIGIDGRIVEKNLQEDKMIDVLENLLK